MNRLLALGSWLCALVDWACSGSLWAAHGLGLWAIKCGFQVTLGANLFKAQSVHASGVPAGIAWMRLAEYVSAGPNWEPVPWF